MAAQFDEFTKSLARSVTRRGALKQFGLGLVGMALAGLGLTSRAAARTHRGYCKVVSSWFGNPYYNGACVDVHGRCIAGTSSDCPAGTLVDLGDGAMFKQACGSLTRVDPNKPCSFTI